jgi:hypothetical protein
MTGRVFPKQVRRAEGNSGIPLVAVGNTVELKSVLLGSGASNADSAAVPVPWLAGVDARNKQCQLDKVPTVER